MLFWSEDMFRIIWLFSSRLYDDALLHRRSFSSPKNRGCTEIIIPKILCFPVVPVVLSTSPFCFLWYREDIGVVWFIYSSGEIFCFFICSHIGLATNENFSRVGGVSLFLFVFFLLSSSNEQWLRENLRGVIFLPAAILFLVMLVIWNVLQQLW